MMAEVIVCLLQMSIVLEMAHRLDDINNQKQIPSKDLLVDKLIFNIGDVVLMEAKNVELDFANKGKLIYFFLKKRKYLENFQLRLLYSRIILSEL